MSHLALDGEQQRASVVCLSRLGALSRAGVAAPPLSTTLSGGPSLGRRRVGRIWF